MDIAPAVAIRNLDIKIRDGYNAPGVLICCLGGYNASGCRKVGGKEVAKKRP